MASSPLIRIVIVDDSKVYRQATSRILQKNPYIVLVAEADNGHSAIHTVEKHRPDVVLMDISMPILNGLDATWIIKSRFPEVNVIILTMYDTEAISEVAHGYGACCCLNKECSMDEIIQAIMDAGT